MDIISLQTTSIFTYFVRGLLVWYEPKSTGFRLINIQVVVYHLFTETETDKIGGQLMVVASLSDFIIVSRQEKGSQNHVFPFWS